MKSVVGPLLLAFAVSSAAFMLVPAIDLRVSAAFFDGTTFPAATQTWNRALHEALGWMIAAGLTALFALYALDRSRGRAPPRIPGRTVTCLVLVLVLGAGLVVNSGLKDHVGRARPRDVEQFGGTARFTPAFVISDQCARNCSFSSGEAAGGFFAVVVARALTRRRSVLALAAAFGCVVALARVAAGAHFLSDVVVSSFVMLLIGELVTAASSRLSGRPLAVGGRAT